MKWNRQPRNRCTCIWVYDKKAKNIQWRKNSLFDKQWRKNWRDTCKKKKKKQKKEKKLDHFLISYTKLTQNRLKAVEHDT